MMVDMKNVSRYDKRFAKYFELVFLFSIFTVPYWLVNFDFEMSLKYIFFLVFFWIAVTDRNLKKYIPFVYILYDALSILVSNQPLNENLFYFIFIGYFINSSLKDDILTRQYLTIYHILLKFVLLIFRNFMQGKLLFFKIDSFLMSNIFFSMSIYFVIQGVTETVSEDLSNTEVVDQVKKVKAKENGNEKRITNQIEFEILKEEIKSKFESKTCFYEDELKNILNHYPHGILICKIVKSKERSKCSIFYRNTKAEEILNLKDTFSDKGIIEQLACFEMINERGSSKFRKTNNYNSFYDYILKSPSNQDEIHQRSIKYANNQKVIITQFVKYIPEKIIFDDSIEFFEYKIFSVENLSEEKKQIKLKLYKSLKSQFLLTISHELNNPLNGLIGFCEKLIYEVNPQKKKKIIDKIKKFRFSIKFFIKNLNLTSKIVLKEKLSMEPKNIIMSHLLISSLNKFRPFLDSKKIKYTTDIKNCNNIVIYYDHHYLKFFFKNILMYVCYRLEGNKIFRIESTINRDKKFIRINFYKQERKILSIFSSNNINKSGELSASEEMSLDQTVQTEEMLRDIINTLSTFLKIRISFDNISTKPIISCDFDYDHIDELNEEFLDVYEFTPGSSHQLVRNMKSVNREVNMSQINELNKIPHTTSIDGEKLNDSSSEGTEILLTVQDVDESGIHRIRNLSRKKPNRTSRRDSNHSVDISQENGEKSLSKFQSDKYRKRGYVQRESDEYVNERPRNSNNKPEYHPKKLSTKNIKSTNQINIQVVSPRIDDTDSIYSRSRLENDKIKPIEKEREITRSPRIFKHETQLEFGKSNEFHNTEYNLSNNLKPILKKNDKPMEQVHVKTSNLTVTECILKTIGCDCKTVLCVDDENFNLKTLKFLMKNFNVIPDTCGDGKQAVDKVKENMAKKCCNVRYKLILMDVMMPIMDGIEASKKIQELISPNNKYDLKIVILSAHDAEYIHQKLVGISIIHDFISKPVKKSKIQDLLNKYVLN